MNAYIWGAGEIGRRAYDYCKTIFQIQGFIDKCASATFSVFCGCKVISPQFYLCKDYNITVIIAVRYPYEVINEIKAQMGGQQRCKIFVFDGRSKKHFELYDVFDFAMDNISYGNIQYKKLNNNHRHYSSMPTLERNRLETAWNFLKSYRTNTQLVEFGCGMGQLANLLFDNGYNNYTGVDISSVAIEQACSMNERHKNCFVCDDAFHYLLETHLDEDTVYICLEMLEHIVNDLELVNLLPSGSKLIFSLPSFKSFNHVRWFSGMDEIVDRYKCLNIIEYTTLCASELHDKMVWYVISAVKEG